MFVSLRLTPPLAKPAVCRLYRLVLPRHNVKVKARAVCTEYFLIEKIWKFKRRICVSCFSREQHVLLLLLLSQAAVISVDPVISFYFFLGFWSVRVPKKVGKKIMKNVLLFLIEAGTMCILCCLSSAD